MAVVSPQPAVQQQAANPCQLYIKVLEARNVKGLDKNGVSDPIVELYLGTQRKNPLSTKVYNKTVNPQWHEEFIFTMPNQSQVITFHVFDYVRIFPNVSLGTAVLDPTSIAPNTAIDTWLPISDGGELHIFAQNTPLQAMNPHKAVRLRTFRMILERNSYYPGEVVRGAIVYNIGMPQKIRGVRVKFEGYTRTSWSETRGTDKNRRTVFYSSHFVYFNPVATLYGNKKGCKDDFMIQSGGYFWPFEFVLPQQLAPSFVHSWGRNSYSVQGYADIPWGFDRTVTENLTMLVEYGTLQPTLNTRFGNQAKALFASNQNISVSLSAPPVAYQGEAFPVDITIDNQGTKEVREVLVSLTAKYYFTAHSVEGYQTKRAKITLLTHKVSGVAGFPIFPGTQWRGQIVVNVPSGVVPSIPDSVSPIIQVYHTIKARMNTVGNVFTKASNEKKLPVLLGIRYPRQLLVPAQQGVVALPPPGQIVIAQAPENVYQYLAPAPMVNGEINPIGPVIPHEAFIGAQAYQPEQWVEQEANAVAYDPHMAPIQSVYTPQQ